MHVTTDVINALIEAVPIVLISIDVHAIYKDKALKGARIFPKFYWLAYGIWCIYFFFLMHLPISGWVAITSTIIYTIYISMCIYYKNSHKRATDESFRS